MSPAVRTSLLGVLYGAALLLASLRSALAMPLHVGNVIPSPAGAEELRIDVAIGPALLLRDLGYKDFATVDVFPGPTELVVFRAGGNARIGRGFVVPPTGASGPELERGYTAFIVRDAANGAITVLGHDESFGLALALAQAPPIGGQEPALLLQSALAPYRGLGATATQLRQVCTEATIAGASPALSALAQPGGELRELAVGFGKEAVLSASLRPAASESFCHFEVHSAAFGSIVLAQVPLGARLTTRVALIGDGALRPVELIALRGGKRVGSAPGLDPLSAMSSTALWRDDAHPELRFELDEPAADGSLTGFLLRFEGTQPRWLMLSVSGRGAGAAQPVIVYEVQRPPVAGVEARRVGAGSLSFENCDRARLELGLGDTVPTQYSLRREQPLGGCRR
jgi:hypothetical protein